MLTSKPELITTVRYSHLREKTISHFGLFREQLKLAKFDSSLDQCCWGWQPLEAGRRSSSEKGDAIVPKSPRARSPVQSSSQFVGPWGSNWEINRNSRICHEGCRGTLNQCKINLQKNCSSKSGFKVLLWRQSVCQQGLRLSLANWKI